MSITFDTTQQVLDWLSDDGKARNPELIVDAGKVKKESKYHNRKTEAAGIVFQSGKEAEDYGKLMLGVRAGEYAFVLRQVPFILQEKPEQIIYVADFVTGNNDGTWEAIDSKGFDEKGQSYRLTDMFKLKQKLFTQKYGRKIKII